MREEQLLQAILQKTDADRVCLGEITAAFGVRGQVRIRPFTSRPENIAAYGPMFNENGDRSFHIQAMRLCDDNVVAKLSGVEKREHAQALSGTLLYVSRAELPSLGEEEWYHADIIGLSVCGPDGEDWGCVRSVWDFGAGELLDIERRVQHGENCDKEGKSHRECNLIPFTRENVAQVEVARERIILTESARRFDWQ